MGSKDDVAECMKYYAEAAKKDPELKARCDARMVVPAAVAA